MAHGNGLELPESAVPSPPGRLEPWPAEPYSLSVLARVVRRADTVTRVACGLLFASGHGRRLLVGTDRSTLALVLSEDAALIERYRADCEAWSLADYRTRCGS
jgi:hypothetical protein